MTVEIVHFNPRRHIIPGPIGRRLPWTRPLNNFGDLLGPLMVERIVQDEGLVDARQHRRLVSIGSVMALSAAGDVVWGTGVNGKSKGVGGAPELDVRAVRGPHTRAALLDAGQSVPEVYGDPGLLWSRFWPREFYTHRTTRSVTHVPNYNDARTRREPHLSPLGEPHQIIGAIAESDFVCGSSLHAIVLAESFGIPARLVRSQAEPSFKYDDYYAGTGRPDYRAATSVAEAVAMGGERSPAWDADALLAAFPRDLWVRTMTAPASTRRNGPGRTGG